MAAMEDQDEPIEGESTESMSAEQLRSRWEQAEKAISHLKGEWGSQKDQMIRENQELKERLAELSGRVDEQRNLFSEKTEEKKADPFELDEETADSFRNDPSQIVSFFKERLKEQENAYLDAVVGLIKDRDGQVDRRFNEFDGTLATVRRVVDPEIAPWKDAIDGLRDKSEALKKLDDKTLIEVAKTMGMQPMAYRGAPGGRRTSQSSEAKPGAFSTDSVAGRLALRLADGDVTQAKKIFERQEKRRLAQEG
jgi:hypothetical protein